MIKGSIQEEITLINIYMPNIGIHTHRNKETDGNTIIVGHFNIPMTSLRRSSRQKINKGTVALNEPLHQLHLIDIYRTFHPKMAECTVFSRIHETFSRDHMPIVSTNLRR